FKDVPVTARIVVLLFGLAGLVEIVPAALRVRALNAWAFGLMLLLAIVTARAKVRLIGGPSLSLLTAVVLTTLMSLGADAAILVGVAGVIIQSIFPLKRWTFHQLVFNTGMV